MAREFTSLGAFAKRRLSRLNAKDTSGECAATLELVGVKLEAFEVSPRAALLSLTREQLFQLASLELSK